MSTIRPVEFPTIESLRPDQAQQTNQTKSARQTKETEAPHNDKQKEFKKALNERALKLYQPGSGTVKKPALLGQNIDIKV